LGDFPSRVVPLVGVCESEIALPDAVDPDDSFHSED
jgi:hypothetical protein